MHSACKLCPSSATRLLNLSHKRDCKLPGGLCSKRNSSPRRTASTRKRLPCPREHDCCVGGEGRKVLLLGVRGRGRAPWAGQEHRGQHSSKDFQATLRARLESHLRPSTKSSRRCKWKVCTFFPTGQLSTKSFPGNFISRSNPQREKGMKTLSEHLSSHW